MKILFKPVLSLLALAVLSGCATTPTGPRIDTSLSAKSQSSRAKFIIVHYTVSDLESSKKILTQQIVSSHYLLTNEAQPITYRLVDETRQANHAGVSHWKNYTLLNGSSITSVHVSFCRCAVYSFSLLTPPVLWRARPSLKLLRVKKMRIPSRVNVAGPS